MGKRVPNRNAALAVAMTRDADLDAGRRKLEEFKKAKDAAKHRDATPSDVEAEQKKEKPEKMKKTSDAGKTDDETAAIKAKLVKAVKKGKAIESERDAAKARAQALEKEIEGLKKTAEASASGERAAAETRDELESMREQLVRNTEALTYANEESHRAAEEARARIAAIEEELEKTRAELREADSEKAAAARRIEAAEEAKSKADDVEKEVGRLKAALREANAARTAAAEESAELRRASEQTTSGAESRALELKSEFESKALKLQSLEAELLALSTSSAEEKEALAAENVRLANKLDENRLVLEEAEKEKEVFVGECERALQANEEHEHMMAEIKQRLRDAESKAESTASELSALKASNESNQATLDAEKRATEALEALDKARQDASRAQAASESQSRELQAKIASLESALQTQRAMPPPPSVSNETASLRQQLDMANKQIEQLQSLLSDARASQNTSSFTNKKNEDFSETDIEGAVLTGGSYAFVPLQGHLKSAASAPALQHPIALEIAANFDRASVYLQRRPFMRLGLTMYLILLHLWIILF